MEASRSKYFFYCCCLFVFFKIKLHDHIAFYNIIRLQLDPLSISLLIVFQFQTLAHIWLGSTLKPRHNHLTSFRLLLKTGSSAHRSHSDSCHNPFFFFWANKIFSFLYCVIVWTWRSPRFPPESPLNLKSHHHVCESAINTENQIFLNIRKHDQLI